MASARARIKAAIRHAREGGRVDGEEWFRNTPPADRHPADWRCITEEPWEYIRVNKIDFDDNTLREIAEAYAKAMAAAYNNELQGS